MRIPEKAWFCTTFQVDKVSQETSDKVTQNTQIEELSRLTGRLAHEIKNPLSTIKVNLDLISEELKTLRAIQGQAERGEQGRREVDRMLRKISVIQRETGRLSQILEGLAKYADGSKLEPTRTDLNEIVCDMVDFYMPKAHRHSIVIHQRLCDKPLICSVDVNMLKEVLLNLFINAQQAMESGGELMVRTNKKDNTAVIEVSDTGKGIEPEKIDHIFEPYYSGRAGGSGIGLATAKRVVELHGGRISVSSETGRGTQFVIELPLEQEK